MSGRTSTINIDIQPRQTVFACMAGTVLWTRAVTANILYDSVFMQTGQIKPRSSRIVERLATADNHMPDRDSNRIAIGAGSTSAPMHNRFGYL